MEECKELRNDALHLVCYEHLVAVELYLVALQLNVRLDAGEVEYTSKVERIVHVKVYPEQRLVLHRIECSVEVLIVLVLESAWCLCPKRLYAVDDVVLISINLLAVLPFGLLAESHRHSHELAVLVEQFLNLQLVKELLAVVIDVKDDVRTTVFSLGVRNLELWASVAAPLDGLRAFLIATSDDLHLLAHHERRVEAETEVTDDGIGVVLILVEEVGYAREGNLVDVFVDFFFCHADTTVADGKRSLVCIEAYAYGKVAKLAFEVAAFSKSLHLLCCVNGV